MKTLVPRLLLSRNHPVKRSHRIIHDLKSRGIDLDATQRNLVEALARCLAPGTASSGYAGCYIYGPPGRGKSMIVDAIFATLDQRTAARYHFHDFFHSIHQASGQAPSGSMGSIFLRGLTIKLEGITVLCFDEFHCVEPGDAMFMARLVNFCQEHGITLLTTSNYEPEGLLADPYFHHLIEPTIAKIRSSFHVVELDHRVDYRTLDQGTRQRTGYRAGSLYTAATPPTPSAPPTSLQIGYDTLAPVYLRSGQLRIGFELLCRTRRNTRDYIEMAEKFGHWIIEGIPAGDSMPTDEQRRFANLVDVLYDRDIRLDLYCSDDLGSLGKDLPGTERQRLTSRLAELMRHSPIRT